MTHRPPSLAAVTRAYDAARKAEQKRRRAKRTKRKPATKGNRKRP